LQIFLSKDSRVGIGYCLSVIAVKASRGGTTYPVVRCLKAAIPLGQGQALSLRRFAPKKKVRIAYWLSEGDVVSFYSGDKITSP